MTLIFETHATSCDNEARLASGHYDAALSPLGESQAKELGARYAANRPALVVASDLTRAWRTAEIAFGGSVPIERDARVRECDYGQLTRRPTAEVDRWRSRAIDEPFPGGESYRQATARVAALLADLARRPGISGPIMLIGHRATHYALWSLLGGVSLEHAVTAPWAWQPGWTYVGVSLSGSSRLRELALQQKEHKHGRKFRRK
ncbi:MAG: histidine phosphatase family protein [Acidobacteriota bacterium]|nr:histidine phosphatase family protein [Acidobacteriota bacterium]